MVAHTVVSMGMLTMLHELLFDCSLLLIIELTVLVGIKLFEDMLLEVGAAFGKIFACGFFFLVIKFAIFVGVKLLKDTLLEVGTTFSEFLAYSFLFLVIEFAVLIGVKSFHETSFHRSMMRRDVARTIDGRRRRGTLRVLRSRSWILCHEWHDQRSECYEYLVHCRVGFILHHRYGRADYPSQIKVRILILIIYTHDEIFFLFFQFFLRERSVSTPVLRK